MTKLIASTLSVVAITLDVSGNITVGGTVDGRDIDADGTILDTAVLDNGNQSIAGTKTFTTNPRVTNTSPAITFIDSDNDSDARVRGGDGSLILEADYTNEQAGSNVRFEIDGAEIARFDATGQLGLGVTPSDQLHIAGSNPAIRLEDTDAPTDGYAVLRANANGSVVISADDTNVEVASAIIMQVDTVEVARVNPAGFTVTGAITVTGLVDGRDVDADGTRLDTMEDGAERSTPAIVAVTTSRDLALTDVRDILEVDTTGGAVIVTIPTFASIAFPVGTIINITLIDITAAATITAAGTVDLNGVTAGSGIITGVAYAGVSLYNRAADDWVVQGAIGAIA